MQTTVKLMNRHLTKLTIAAALFVSLLFPQIAVSDGDATDQRVDREYHRSLPVTSESFASDGIPGNNARFSRLLEHEIADPSSMNFDVPCDSDSHLCEWWAQHRSKSDDEPPTSDANQIVPERDNDPDRDREASKNRNVVGWSSASINAVSAEQHPDPVGLDVPSLGISADVRDVGTDANRAMEVPDDFNTVGWYRHGPSPGEAGNAVIAGHLDDQRGRSVFFDLQHVEIDSTILVTYEDGSDAEFRVFDKRAYDAGNLPSERLFKRDGDPVLALMTCGGSWDSSAGRYTETVVVYAEPV